MGRQHERKGVNDRSLLRRAQAPQDSGAARGSGQGFGMVSDPEALVGLGGGYRRSLHQGRKEALETG